MIRVLLVENEPQARRAISISLRARGYHIDTAASGDEALRQALVETPDGILLDVGVPDVRAAELVRLLRPWTAGPIVLMSAADQEGDKLAALKVGADDYVTKPFGMPELLDRLRAVLPTEAGGGLDSNWVETPHFVLDLATPCAYAGGEEVPLTPLEWRLVVMLVRQRGRLVLESALLEQAGGLLAGEPSAALRRAMAAIRGRFEPDPACPRYFLSEPGLGWRFVAS